MQIGQQGSRCYVSKDHYLYDKLDNQRLVQDQSGRYRISPGVVGVHIEIAAVLAFLSDCVLPDLL